MLFFQPLLLDSRLMISYYVTYNVTIIIGLFIVQENKRNIKSRKINKKKKKKI